jgi:riboflavin kinase/FMN adenylyltransferase
MKVFRSSLPLELPTARRVVALGSFDGLHLGHQAVLKRTIELSRKYQATSAALTFDPLPGLFFNHSGKQRLLTTLAQKTRLIEQLGLEEMVVLTFDTALASLSPYEFARQILKEGLEAFLVICGPGHRFGAGGGGDCLSLVSAGLSLSAEVVPPVLHEGQPVSSTRIRELVESSQLEAAAQCLGRPYSITGTQVQGKGKGTQLGFPTVNLRWDRHQQLPPSGVYACQVGIVPKQRLSERPTPASGSERQAEPLSWAAVSLGTKPTFGGSSLALELHFLASPPPCGPGFIYEVLFLSRLRGQIRFESEQALKEQMAQDCLAVRRLAENA